MMKHYILITVILTSFLVGCKKDDSNIQTGSTLTNYPLFTGYTSTDNNGAPTWLTDSTDWTNDTSWISSEKSLFPQYLYLTHDFEPYSSIQFHPAYPNPTTSTTNFYLTKATDIRLSFKVVNSNFNVIASSDSIYSNSFGVNTAAIISPVDTMIRIYYIFERNDSCLYKGHGDIKID